MKRTKLQCSKCGRLISKSNYTSHNKKCDGIDRSNRSYSEDPMVCPTCGKKCKNERSFVVHNRMMHTVDGKKHRPLTQYVKNTEIWNKGLTKNDSDSIKQQSESIKQTISEQGHPFLGRKHTQETKDNWKKNPNMGGYRPGSGRGKSGWYNGYWCDSSYELAYVIYNIDHNINFTRNKDGYDYVFKGKTKKYYPDFIEDGKKFIEIKGYIVEEDHAKFEYFPHELTILHGDDIQPYLCYVKNKYGANFIRLYEMGS